MRHAPSESVSSYTLYIRRSCQTSGRNPCPACLDSEWHRLRISRTARSPLPCGSLISESSNSQVGWLCKSLLSPFSKLQFGNTWSRICEGAVIIVAWRTFLRRAGLARILRLRRCAHKRPAGLTSYAPHQRGTPRRTVPHTRGAGRDDDVQRRAGCVAVGGGRLMLPACRCSTKTSTARRSSASLSSIPPIASLILARSSTVLSVIGHCCG
jgi:hypothetical protein